MFFEVPRDAFEDAELSCGNDGEGDEVGGVCGVVGMGVFSLCVFVRGRDRVRVSVEEFCDGGECHAVVFFEVFDDGFEAARVWSEDSDGDEVFVVVARVFVEDGVYNVVRVEVVDALVVFNGLFEFDEWCALHKTIIK